LAASARVSRQKISTTVSVATLSYLQKLIEAGEARTLAEAIDLTVQQLLAYENRERLARDTSAYFDGLSPEVAKEESELGAALAGSIRRIDFDREP